MALGLFAQPEFARPKEARSGKQKFTATRATSVAAKPAPQPEVGKVILVLQTRDNLVTVRSTGGNESRYSVSTLQGIALADGLSPVDLKNRSVGLLQHLAAKLCCFDSHLKIFAHSGSFGSEPSDREGRILSKSKFKTLSQRAGASEV